jgi:hypothetical protein
MHITAIVTGPQPWSHTFCFWGYQSASESHQLRTVSCGVGTMSSTKNCLEKGHWTRRWPILSRTCTGDQDLCRRQSNISCARLTSKTYFLWEGLSCARPSSWTSYLETINLDQLDVHTELKKMKKQMENLK